MQPAVFLDKDGTLIEDVPYNVQPDRIRFCGGVEGLRSLHQAGYRLIVISNQAGVAHGYFPEDALRAVEQRIREMLAAIGVPLAGFYYCPHHPEGAVKDYAIACDCRKPQPGMLWRAAREQAIDLQRSWFVGDILHDVEAGNRAGCRTVLIDNGNETEWSVTCNRIPHYTARSLHDAAAHILAHRSCNAEVRSHDR